MNNIPNQLKQKEFRFIRIKPQEKIPIEKNWQKTKNYYYKDDILQKHTGNIGLATGYGNIVVVDFDNLEVQNKVLTNMPQTFTTSSGNEEGLVHCWFIVDNPENIKILDNENNTLVDIQGKGKQILVPPSIHPRGTRYKVINDLPIAKIHMAEIKALFVEYIKPKEKKKQDILFQEDIVSQIKNKILVPTLLSKFNVSIDKNPTECPLHASRGGKCLSFKDDLWYCFHCNRGGDIFTLYQLRNKCDFPNAKIELAKMAGIELKKINTITLNLQNYMANAEEFWHQNPYFYDDGSKIFWLWDRNGFKYEMVSETKLMLLFDDILGFMGQTVTSTIKNNHLEAFKRFGIKKKPQDAPLRWIQFKDKAFSLRSEKIYDINPNFFFTNPIPWEIGKTEETPFLDKLFAEWVGKDNVDVLYEFIAYCCYRGYPIQLLFCLYGHGRNGKSTFIKIVDTFLGEHNTCTTDLDMIAGKNKNRFETIRMYKKLACFMGETHFNILENSSILKKLVGGDRIAFELKGGGLFDDFNYAKIIIASNSLPSSEDTSEGFYRRWHIIDFPNEFPEGKDISLNMPEIEFNNLARKIIRILPKLLEKAEFSHQGSIEDRKQKYILASNPFPFFIDNCCYQKPEGFIRYSKLYLTYTNFLKANKRRIVSKKEFTRVLNAEGFENRRTTKEGEIDQYVEGLELKKEFADIGVIAKNTLSNISKKTNYDFHDNPDK
jgi:P4 family phage/plasmid primase-like protien